MGLSLNKFGSKKDKDFEPIIEQCYHKYFVNSEDWSLADFHHAICRTIEEINETLGSTQFRVPTTSTIRRAYKVSALGLEVLSYVKSQPGIKEKFLTKEEFQNILQIVILESEVTNIIGTKDILLYMYGVPATALFLKQCLVPKLIPNEVFIPCVTSATVFLLAKLHMI